MDQRPERDLLQYYKECLEILVAGKIPSPPVINDLIEAPEVKRQNFRSATTQTINNTYTPEGVNDELISDCFTQFQTLIAHLDEIRCFMQELCQGNLDAVVPGRRNYLAAPLKELHTQLASLTWSMGQLARGNVVSRLYYRGELFEAYNSLIEKVASVSNQLETAKSNEQKWAWSVNSWRYHQILSALNNLHIMVLEVSLDGKIIYANKPAREYFGDIEYLSAEPVNSRTLINGLENYLAQINREDENTNFPIVREIYDESNNRWYKITSDRVEFTDAMSGYLHMIDNISEWKKHESSLKQTALTDPLTGIYNRGYGLQAIEDAIFGAKTGTPYCAAFIDIDGLKIINDKFGHNSGDYAICTIADTIASSVRDNRDTVCRFGGDEFIIIFKNCVKAAAQQAISRMLRKLDLINSEHDKGYDLEFSFGIIEIDANRENDLRGLIEKMDQCMYENKTARKKTARKETAVIDAAGEVKGGHDIIG